MKPADPMHERGTALGDGELSFPDACRRRNAMDRAWRTVAWDATASHVFARVPACGRRRSAKECSKQRAEDRFEESGPGGWCSLDAHRECGAF